MSTNPPIYVMGPRNGAATASLTLGILSVVLICVPILSTIAAIIAISLGYTALGRIKAGTADASGAAMWGIILGFAHIAFLVVGMAFWIVVGATS